MESEEALRGTAPAPVYRFGVFELNPHLGELRKHGLRLQLQEQPLRILSSLLENAGEVVSREQVRARLWAPDTYVDCDNAINSAVRKLRDAPDDTAENPRFIETLARRGYRFVAPVFREPAAAAGGTPRARSKWPIAAILVWFMQQTGAGIALHSVGTGSAPATTMLPLGRFVFRGLAVSPDEHWALYSQADVVGSDLKLVENVR
jgi:DNA-binding winged helix-turn-helix (wHTH) protein